jgi:hypothetical protein
MPAFNLFPEMFKGISGRIMAKTILSLDSCLILSHFLSGYFFCLGFRSWLEGFASVLIFFILFRFRITVPRVMFRFSAVKAFKVILWFLTLFFLELIFFSSFKRITRLLIYYIGISFFFMTGISYSFVWFLLGVFKAPEAVIQADCQIYHFIKIVRVCDYCYRALNPGFQAIKKPRYPGSIVLGNPRAVLVKFN